MRTATPPIDDPELARFAACILGAVRRDGRDLTLRQVAVLMHIEHAPLERRKLRCIAEDLAISRPAAVRAMNRLEREMLASRIGNPNDLRDSVALINPQGRAWLRALATPPQDRPEARRVAA